MPFLLDPLYLIVMGIAALLSIWASFQVKGTFARYSKRSTRAGVSGAEIARAILRSNGIDDVHVERVPGSLSDHYDPMNRVLRLSEPVYGSSSMAALGVAAHEVGHAIQHAQGYAPLKFRSAWVPVANVASGLSGILLMAGFFLGMAGLAKIGVVAFAATTLFTLITLPVEFDASKRALIALEGGGFVTEEELTGARRVLNAAAMTYVAAFVTSLLQLLYFAYRAGLIGGSRDE